MGNYSKKEYEPKIDLSLPKLTSFERSVLRVEILLLGNKSGFYKSHIEKYLNAPEGVTDKALESLGAVEFNGFWFHPHFYHNIRENFIGYTCHQGRTSVEDIKRMAGEQIQANPGIAVHKLMYALRLYSPNDLSKTLRAILLDNIDRNLCYAVSCYLYRHFGVAYQVM